MSQPTAQADAINVLAARFEALRIAYERFIVGIDRVEPSQLRQQFIQQLRQALGRPPNNTALNFRLQAIKARMLTYEAMWDRSVLARETSGTRGPRPQGAGAQESSPVSSHASAPTAPTPPAAATLEELYGAYVAASEAVKQAAPTFAAFAAMVDKQIEGIKSRTGWQDVGLRVAQHNGRPALQAYRRSSGT